jgi:hypothetical protein
MEGFSFFPCASLLMVYRMEQIALTKVLPIKTSRVES